MTICAECGGTAELVAGVKVYLHRPYLHGRKIWLCRCGAYVGSHPGTSRPLGSPAGPQLRRLRSLVHAGFDPLWQRKITRDGVARHEARAAAYNWLSDAVGTPPERTHVGMFTVDECRRALSALAAARRPRAGTEVAK